MPSPQVRPGLGTVLQVETATPGTYITVAQRVSIDGPDLQVGEAKTTHLDSTAASYRPTLPDTGELSMQVEYDPADTSHQRLTTLMAAPVVCGWKLIFPWTAPNNTYAFQGFLKGFKPGGMTEDGNLTADVTIRTTGTFAIS